MKIKEVIVVEGKDDEAAVKSAVDAEIIITHGFGISSSTMKRIKVAQKRCGVIIFTDPDHAGEQIRSRIDRQVKGCMHAFLPREDATKNGDIGIENATPQSIINALSKVHTMVDISDKEYVQIFSNADLIRHGLIGSAGASDNRAKVGAILGIGYANAKQFLRRLNHYGITRDEFNHAINML